MAIPAALGLLGVGVAFGAIGLGWGRAGRRVGSAVGLYGALALALRAAGDIGSLLPSLWFPQGRWHQLFLHNGRMAPATAAALLMVGAALPCSGRRALRRSLVPALAGGVAALAITPVLQFTVWLGSRHPGTPEYANMALPAAAAFIAAAVGLLCISYRRSERAPACLSLALGILFAIGLVGLQTQTTAVEAARMVAHTYEVRATVDQFVAEVARSDAAAQAYAATGKASLRDQAAAHEQAAWADLAKITALVADNSEQQARAGHVRLLITAHFHRGPSASPDEAFVAATDAMHQAEDRLLLQRQALLDEESTATRWLELCGGAVGLLLLVAALAIAKQSREARQRAEAEFERRLTAARDHALQLSRAKSVYLAMMSHEIRTPMNGVIGMARILAERPLPREEQEMARIIHESAGSLVRLINDALDHAKIEAGKLEIEPRWFSCTEVLRNIGLLFQPAARPKGLEIRVRVGAGLRDDCELLGDDGRLRQIIANLVGNALKFTERGEIEIAADYQQGQVEIAVRDTGIGISSPNQQLLFRSFQQIPGSGKSADGTGLGLAISKQLAELMGGTLAVESALGRGSTFTLTLPLERRAGTPPSAVAAPRNLRLDGVRVLLVDDNHVNREVGRRMLQDVGAHVDTAASGAQALATLARQEFDAVLTDCLMPEMDGYELTRRIRSGQVPGVDKTIRIAGISASMGEDYALRCRIAGMNATLDKPFQREQLVAFLASA